MSALSTYASRLASHRTAYVSADQVAARYGNLRLLIVALGLYLSWQQAWLYVGLTVLAFFALGVYIQRLDRAASRHLRAIAWYEQSLERLAGRWQGKGSDGLLWRPAEHLYAYDLDLFGRGSLFELLSQARTRIGESTLASWLLSPATPPVITARQQSIAELAPLLDLREDLAVITGAVPRQIHAVALADWGAAPPSPLLNLSRPLYLALTALGALAVLALFADIFDSGIPHLRLFYLPVSLLAGALFWRHRAATEAVLNNATGAAAEVSLLAGVLERLERQSFTAAHLVHLRDQLNVAGSPPSVRIAQLRKLMDLVDSRGHFLIRLLGPLVHYDLNLALALERWRQLSGASMRIWLDAVGEFEALSSLANFHYERPHTTFPIILDGPPTFAGEQLTHPLMPLDQAVPNDVALTPPLQALIVSGSNMSGKSTIMRTVGVNTVLALAGAPVSARSLSLTPLAIGASISTHDSLEANTSRFYAEILRLRDIMQKASAHLPVLFLIDEVLSGTNSHDRRIGASAIIKGLVARRAIGIATTHDLALTQIVEDLTPHAANVHFEDQLIDGKMRFDYKMHPGIVTHSNAIALMRAIGLEV
jgi:hypothetical protein